MWIGGAESGSDASDLRLRHLDLRSRSGYRFEQFQESGFRQFVCRSGFQELLPTLVGFESDDEDTVLWNWNKTRHRKLL